MALRAASFVKKTVTSSEEAAAPAAKLSRYVTPGTSDPIESALKAAYEHMPKHVAVIMDGNGRWAQARKLPRSAGHKQGAEALRTMLHACPKLGVKHLTVYAFSAENWQRPSHEINDLFGLMRYYLKRELAELKANGIRLHIIGDLSNVSEDMLHQIRDAEKQTADNTDFDFTVCFSYGGRQEMTHAALRMAEDVVAGQLPIASISEKTLETYLYTSHLPEPDLLIRTGGEKRLSNFLLWQSAYTELYFTNTLWPDFSEADFAEACRDFSLRERRYGLTD